MKKKEEIIVYQNPDPLLVSKQGIFPGVSLLPNNDLIIILVKLLTHPIKELL